MLEAISSRFNQAVSINGSSNHHCMHHSVKVLSIFIGACLIHNIWKKKHSQAVENVCELGVLKVVSYTIDVRNLEEIVRDIHEANKNLKSQIDELKKNKAEMKNTIDKLSETTKKFQEENATLKQSIEQLRESRLSLEETIDRIQDYRHHLTLQVDELATRNKELNMNVELRKEKSEAFNTKFKKIEEQLAILEQQRKEEQARHEKVMLSSQVLQKVKAKT